MGPGWGEAMEDGTASGTYSLSRLWPSGAAPTRSRERAWELIRKTSSGSCAAVIPVGKAS